MTFGLESRALALSLLLSGLLGWLALHEYRAQAVATEACNTRLAVEVNTQNTATAADQHSADAANIAALQQQIQQLQSDAEHAASIKIRLQAQLHDQNEVLTHVLKTAKPGDCLNQRVPGALIDSLHTGAPGAADARSGGDAVSGPAHRTGTAGASAALRHPDRGDVVGGVAGLYLRARGSETGQLSPRRDREAGAV